MSMHLVYCCLCLGRSHDALSQAYRNAIRILLSDALSLGLYSSQYLRVFSGVCCSGPFASRIWLVLAVLHLDRLMRVVDLRVLVLELGAHFGECW